MTAKKQQPLWWEEFYGESCFMDAVGFPDEAKTAEEVRFIIDALELPAGARILDVCCGYGRHALQLARRGFFVVGLDYSREYLRRASVAALKNALPVRFVRADMRAIPFMGQFDAVLSLLTSIGFFERESEDEGVFVQMAQAAKPQAKLFIDVANHDWVIRDYAPTHQKDWLETPDGSIFLMSHDVDAQRYRIRRRVIRIRNGERCESGFDIRMYNY
ncbi:MAG: class I SAM-dependent methyltransferase, partial [Candidatus Poribacteria bacterium]